MKTPKELRSEILKLRHQAGLVREMLQRKAQDNSHPSWGIKADCEKAASSIDLLLKNQTLPESYKVAIVGRFKAGKSSFVNELLGARLAGEDTTPETAAVTTFCHGPSVTATVRFVSAETWEKLTQLYDEDPKHIDAHRVRMWKSFDGKAKKSQDGKPGPTFDLATLARTFIKAGGHSVQIRLEQPGDKTSESNFRRRLKEFTSGKTPHHCLVEGIEITYPSKLLDEGVLLVDTPGLDDTERFRVSLTEKSVEDADAVLFLTQSGSAYGQSEKDFILTLLRKGTVKQLIFVITQVDKTYEQELAAAEDNDEDPPSLTQFISREERRIREEIDATLNELGEEDSPSVRRYREQLGEVGLAFTSARKHRDWKDGKVVQDGIFSDDPGGIKQMEQQLLLLLSTESRLALVARNIATGAKTALEELLGAIASRRSALSSIKDGEVAERRLATFRLEFESAKNRFRGATESELDCLRHNIQDADKRNHHLIETIALLAERELADFESNDVGRHWKTRRSGYWGYMYNLQGRVANKIFPRVQELLSEMTARFATFVDHFEAHLSSLSQSSAELAEKLELVDSLPFDLSKTLSDSLSKSLAAANELIAAEEQQIVSFLDDFVSDEVSEKIAKARESVSEVYGKGTTYYQSAEVRVFYAEVKRLLSQALTDHLNQRASAFGNFLVIEADGVPRNALAEVEATLIAAENDIKAAATVKVGGARESFERECDQLTSSIGPVITDCDLLLADGNHCTQVIGNADSGPGPGGRGEASPEEWYELVQERATQNVGRYRLRDGDTEWPYEKIFSPNLLKGCLRLVLVDPYLASHHQVRNLKEFLLVAAEAAKPKEILVITSSTWNEGGGANVRAVDQAASDLFRTYGTALNVRVDPTIHDRCVVCDHGVLFKLGRGLDIYKPATGLASHRQGSRRVRATDIDVFSVPDIGLSKE